MGRDPGAALVICTVALVRQWYDMNPIKQPYMVGEKPAGYRALGYSKGNGRLILQYKAV
jgi:hypothetical protein